MDISGVLESMEAWRDVDPDPRAVERRGMSLCSGSRSLSNRTVGCGEGPEVRNEECMRDTLA